MAWSSLANNQWVSRTDLQNAVTTGVFTLKAGQSIPVGNNWVTRTNVETWINATVSNGTSLQWPQKSWIIPAACPGGIQAYETADIFYSENFNDFPDCFYFNSSNSRYYLEPAFTNLATGFIINTANTSIDRINAGVGSTYIQWLSGENAPSSYSSFSYLGDGGCNFGHNGTPGNVNSYPPPFLAYMRKGVTYNFSVTVTNAVPSGGSEFAVVFWTGDPNDSGMTHVKKFTSSYFVTTLSQTYNFSVTTDNTWTDVMGVGIIGKTGVYCTAQTLQFTLGFST